MTAHVLAVVIGRAGSRGLPGKNMMLVADRPMICHTLDDALAAETIDQIIVTTDGAAIAQAADSMNIRVVHRPDELASDTATVDAAVRHAVTQMDTPAKIIVILYANVPVRPVGLIDRAVRMLIETGADSVQSYADVGKYHPLWMMRLDEDQRIEPYERSTVYRRQDLPPLYIPDGGVIAVTRENLFTVVEGQPHAFLGHDRRGITSPAGSVIDIDTAADLAVAETRLLQLTGKNAS